MSKIALVDDDRNILTSVSMTLEAEGFEVETYNDGQQAFDAFSKRLPDMAVLDIKMPRMDGMDLLQRLRQKSKMPVIFLTSKDDEIDEVLGLRMGADDYVKKPFSQRLLVERIRALLRRQDALPATRPEPRSKRQSSWCGAICPWIRCVMRCLGKIGMYRSLSPNFCFCRPLPSVRGSSNLAIS